MLRRYACVLVFLFVVGPTYAASSPWSGQADFGMLTTRGNTQSKSMNGKLEVNYQKGRWHHLGSVQGIYTAENGVTTGESYTVHGKSEYTLHKYDYIFGDLRYSSDRFSGYPQRISESTGVGWRLLHSSTQTLDLETGAGAQQSKLSDGTRQNDAIVHLAGKYVWNFSKTASFSQNVLVESGVSNTHIESVTAVQSRLYSHLGLKLSETVKHNSHVLPGLKKTDSYTAVSLVYNF